MKPSLGPGLFTSLSGARSVAMAAALLLAACGGGQDAEQQTKGAQASEAAAPQPTEGDGLRPTVTLAQLAQGGSALGPASAADQAQLSQGTRLSGDELQAAEQKAQAAEQSLPGEASQRQTLAEFQPGQIVAKSAYLSGEVARKAAAVRIPAYRFYNGGTGAHFYTTSESERVTVASTLSPPFSFDGPAFSVASDHSAGLSSVHRFYNTRTGVHFYTISEAERANVVATLPHFVYEGVAYFGSQVAGAGLVPLYRFYVPSRGFHFYTASAAEKANIETNLGATYTYEGIGYYVLDTGWANRARLPHTGITNGQCYRAGSNVLEACGGSAATALNPQQDGHRTEVAPMSYGGVVLFNLPMGPVYYANTTCVRDNVTGLVWEGKEASGTRAGSNIYTNLGNGAATDASGYVAAVNASGLCGFSDWRLPTRNELLSLMDYGKLYSSIKINTTWFPNTSLSPYWTSESLSTDSERAWHVMWNSGGGFSFDQPRTVEFMVRLVRGAASTGPRYSYSTVAYGSDGTNNVVNDARTGLQWRRCEQGRVWSGNACTGSASTFDHEAALAHARVQTGWRLPNIKEQASLVDLSTSSGARIDPTAFPGAGVLDFWSTSPSQVAPTYSLAWYVGFNTGLVADSTRASNKAARLVRASP